MVTRLSCLICALGLLVLAGCTGGDPLTCINVSVASVSPDPDAKAPLESIAVKMIYANENVLSVASSQSDYKLYLDGQLVATCKTHKPVGMPAVGVATETMIFKVLKPDILRQLAVSGHSVNYTVDCHLEVFVDEDHLVATSSNKGIVDLTPLAPKG